MRDFRGGYGSVDFVGACVYGAHMERPGYIGVPAASDGSRVPLRGRPPRTAEVPRGAEVPLRWAPAPGAEAHREYDTRDPLGLDEIALWNRTRSPR